MNAISQDCLDGISSNLAQTLTQGWTYLKLLVKGQDYCVLTKPVLGYNLIIHLLVVQFHTSNMRTL